MSNFLSIATVTATLQRTLQDALDTAAALHAPGAVSGATVRAARPDGVGGNPPPRGVNLFLYQVTPNAAWRNADLPTRLPNGQVMQQSQAALDLHYLLTFYGNDTDLEPQRMLGVVVSTLHSRPILTRAMIRQTITNPPYDSFLTQSDLADEIEMVRFTPTSLSLEELSKLWSVFFQTSYALSVSYIGTVVLIEGEEMPQRAMPVLERRLYVVPFRHPVIEQVIAQGGAAQPITEGSTLLILGKRLRGDITHVRIGNTELIPPEATDARISLLLSIPPFAAGALRAGVQAVQVIQPMMLGEPPAEHRGIESNVAAFVLRPIITSVNIANVTGTGPNPRSADMTIGFNPDVGTTQRVVLLLNERGVTDPRAYTFAAPARNADSSSIMIPVTSIRAGEYFVRVQVDGAESPVDLDPASPTFGPTATIS